MAAQYKTTTPPAVEPVTTAEAKTHARIFVVDAAEDAYVDSLIAAAREKLEGDVCRAFVTRSVEARLDAFPDPPIDYATSLGRFAPPTAPIALLYPPLQSVESISYVDADGVTQTLDPADYVVTPGTPGTIAPAPGKAWPTAIDRPGAVTIAFTAGFGADATAVPEVAKLVVKILVAHWYDRREPIVTGTIVAQVPHMVDALSDSLRWGSYP
jgi:uncharacterized phiE125 gp8 family phage protein